MKFPDRGLVPRAPVGSVGALDVVCSPDDLVLKQTEVPKETNQREKRTQWTKQASTLRKRRCKNG